MLGHAFEHLFAVLHRQLKLPDHEVQRGAFVPGFGESGALGDDVAEDADRLQHIALFHLGGAIAIQGVNLFVAGATPHLPDGAQGHTAQAGFLVMQARKDCVGGIGGADDGQPVHGFKALLRVAVVQRAQRLLLGHGFFGL